MSDSSEKLKRYSKKVALFCSLFLAFSAIGFYLINLDFGSPSKKAPINEIAPFTADVSAELQNRLGSTSIPMETYSDWAKKSGLNSKNGGLDADPDNDGLPNYLEYLHAADPLNADTDGDGFSDKQEIVNGYDPDAPGDAKPIVDVSIAKINVDAPMVWSNSMDDQAMLADLENGISHFYETASPGQNGNAVISGHSSNYVWAKGNYNHIFKNLNDLQAGDIINIKTTQQNGRVISYAYKVSDKFVTTADDPRVFADTTEPVLTLSTCWPIGTSLKRLIVKAEIVR